MATGVGRGGRREGAGRKPAGYVPPQERLDYEAARARNEAAKAALNELELAIRKGEYVERAAVREAASTALASLAQTLRSVPDNLERRLGLAPEIAQEVGMMIDQALDEVADQFEAMAEAVAPELEAIPERESDDD